MRFLIIIFLLSSCSAQYHLKKAVKKGAKLKTIEVVKHDTTYFSEHFYQVDTVFNKQTIVEYVPKTRFQTRIEYRFDSKRFKDSLKWHFKATRDTLNHLEYLYKQEQKTVRKNENKFNRFFNSLMVFFILILILYIGARIVASKLLK